MNPPFWPKNPKANFQNDQMNVSYCFTMNYEQKTMNNDNKNKPKQSQFIVSLSNYFKHHELIRKPTGLY